MIYLWSYLAIGVAVGYWIAKPRWFQVTKPKWQRELLAELDPEQKKLWWRVRRWVIFPMFIVLLLVVFWPLGLLMVYIDWKNEQRDDSVAGDKEETAFSVRREDLQMKVTVAEVELRERVVDPLGAVSHQPFGHLFLLWQAFLQRAPEGAHLWSFSVRWEGDLGERSLRSGYAWVRSDEVADFVVMRSQPTHL